MTELQKMLATMAASLAPALIELVAKGRTRLNQADMLEIATDAVVLADMIMSNAEETETEDT